MVEMQLASVRVEMPTNNPVVLLRETEGDRRTLLIYIGTAEAQAIVDAMQGTRRPRPMTHDLMRDILGDLGATVERVVLTELVDQVYFAELHIRMGGKLYTVSSRPSDAMALAVRTSAPIFAEESLLNEAGVLIEEEDEAPADSPEELVDQFHEFIQGIKPEDFAS